MNKSKIKKINISTQVGIYKYINCEQRLQSKINLELVTSCTNKIIQIFTEE